MIRYRGSKKVKDPADSAHAYEYAIFLLSLSLRTEQELRQKMKERGYLPVIIDEITARLLTEKLIDDERYAEIYIENLKRYKDYGYFMIKKKLMQKLLPKETIEAKLDEFVDKAEELKIGARFLKKQSEPDKQKLARKMQARGFRIDVISKLLFRVPFF